MNDKLLERVEDFTKQFFGGILEYSYDKENGDWLSDTVRIDDGHSRVFAIHKDEAQRIAREVMIRELDAHIVLIRVLFMHDGKGHLKEQAIEGCEDIKSYLDNTYQEWIRDREELVEAREE